MERNGFNMTEQETMAMSMRKKGLAPKQLMKIINDLKKRVEKLELQAQTGS